MGLNRTWDEQRYWDAKLGPQRDWIWRGWPVRYSVSRPSQDHDQGHAPLLLIHGFGAAVEHWRHNVPVLGRDRTIYALDLLGFGGSRKASTQYTLDLWVDQLYQFWRLLIQRPIVLVGNSLGSLVCARAAQLHPEMVDAVVLINLPDVSLRQAAIPAPLRPVVNAIESLFAPPPLIKLILRVVRRPAMIRRWVKIAYPDPTAVDDELVALLSNPAYDVGAGDTLVALSKSLRQPQFSPPMREVIAALTQPILLLWGECDRMVPFALSQQFTGLNPRLTFVPLPGAGHCPHDECPDQFHHILSSWLAAQRSGKAAQSYAEAI